MSGKNDKDTTGRQSERLGSECECINWASENLTAQLLTGHHARCPRGGDQLKSALALIAELAEGIEQWAAEEDGVYDGVWKAYQKAKALQGVFLSIDPNTKGEAPL